jgi:hypothetical protein
MPDNWGFVAAAYAIAAGVLLGYWRRLRRLERELDGNREPRPDVRSHSAPGAGHPRSAPSSRHPSP